LVWNLLYYYQRFFLYRGASQLNAEKYPSNLIRVIPAKGKQKEFWSLLEKAGSFFLYLIPGK